MRSERTQLYRHFGRNGILLYVGISLKTVVRLIQHRKASAWFDDITRIEVTHFPCREDAEIAEAVAIRDEKPMFNVARPKVREKEVIPDISEYPEIDAADCYTEAELAADMGLHVKTLAKHRRDGSGPKAVRSGDSILYPESWVDRWYDTLPVYG